jgi:hypothetical protein
MGADVRRRWDTFLGHFVGEVIVRRFDGAWVSWEGMCLSIPDKERLAEFRSDKALRRAMKLVAEVTQRF